MKFFFSSYWIFFSVLIDILKNQWRSTGGKVYMTEFHSIGPCELQGHWLRTCEGYFPNSLRPISYLGVMYLYVFGLKTKVLCRKKNQIHFPMDKGTYPQMPQKISAHFVCPSPKVRNFWKKKLSLGVRSPCPRSFFALFDVRKHTKGARFYEVELTKEVCICHG